MKKELVRPATKKVAIIGYAPTVNETPFDDESWEIWGINSLYRHIGGVPFSRFSRWFEIHSKEYLQKTDPEHWEKLKEFKKVYMTEHHPEIPGSERYPLEAVLDKLRCERYFTNSISYMIALAIAEGYEEIGIYGVDMAVGTEYEHQRPSCEYFIGIAHGLGIQLHIPQASDLLKALWLYGFEDEKRSNFEMKCQKTIEYANNKIKEAVNQEQQIRDVKNNYIGALQATKDLMKVWG